MGIHFIGPAVVLVQLKTVATAVTIGNKLNRKGIKNIITEYYS